MVAHACNSSSWELETGGTVFQGHSWYPGLDETLSLKKESFPKMTNITDAKIYMKQRKLYKTSSQEKKKTLHG